MKDFLEKLFVKYRELILYGIFGVLTTVVNYAVYLTAAATGMHYIVANGIAWIVAVLFAYIVNRKWVFESRSDAVLAEFLRFVGSRIFSLVAESAALYLLVDLLRMDDRVAKLIGIVINVVINYFLGKCFVFKKKEIAPEQTPESE